MLMFWGLVLEPSKRYTQKVQQAFHLSQAALELCDGDSEPIQLILEFDGSNYVLGTLSRKASLFQVPLDLNFNTGDQISFRTLGRGRVHLTGYHISDEDTTDAKIAEATQLTDERIRAVLAQHFGGKGKRKKSSSKSKKAKKAKLSKKAPEPSDDDSAEDEASEEEVDGSDDEVEEEYEFDDEESDNEDDDDDESDEDDGIAKGKKKSSAKKVLVAVNGKSPKTKKLGPGRPAPKAVKKIITPTKVTKEKTPKTDKKSPKGEKKDQNKQDLYPQKKVVEGGVIIEELKVGHGQVAKPGKMAQVYYVGKLQSNKKQFDATTQGPGFKFRLGKGEVIRGWDIGVNGMKVGGKRRITIPAQLGYGAKGAPPAIPPNSVLVFDVELKAIS